MRPIVVLMLAVAVMAASGMARFMGWHGLPTALLDCMFLASTAASLALVIAFEAQRLHRHFDAGSDLPRPDRRDRPGPADDPREDD